MTRYTLRFMSAVLFAIVLLAACGTYVVTPAIECEIREPVDWLAKDLFAETAPMDERHRQWIYDIGQVRTQVFTVHPKFSNPDLSVLARNINMGFAFDEALATLADNVPELTDFEVKLGIQRALVVFQDAHFIFDCAGWGESFVNKLRYNRYPLLFRWLYDGFYLLRAHKDFSAALNHRLIAVNGMCVDDVFAYFTDFWSVENVYGARYSFVYFLMQPDMLNALEIISGREATFTFATVNDEMLNITVSEEHIIFNRDLWCVQWKTMPDIVYYRAAGDIPLTHRYPAIRNWQIFLEEYGLLYIRINAFWSFDRCFTQTFNGATNILRIRDVQTVVIDARGNGGGDENPYLRHFQTIANYTPPGRLFYLIDEGTFSAAALAAGYLYRLGATLAGQPSRQLTEFYAYSVYITSGETHPRFVVKLRYSDYALAVPNVFHTVDMDTINSPDLILRPHILIAATIDDWVNNRDPVLDFITESSY